jgi:hypothetical protein
MMDRAAKTPCSDAFARAAKALASAYLGARDQLEPVTREELARRLQDGNPLVVLDVRPAAEHAAGLAITRA